jgi:hypothetical protein
MICMGGYLPPVVAERWQVLDQPTLMTISVHDWLRLKDAIHHSPNLCKAAIDATAESCVKEAESLAKMVQKRETQDQKLIDSLKRSLEAQEKLAADEAKRARHLKWVSIAASSVAVITTTIMVLK